MIKEKEAMLRGRIAELAKEDMAVAFSGGVDSSLLLRLAAEETAKNGKRLYAVTADTQLHPSGDRSAAEQIFAQIREQVREALPGAEPVMEHLVLELDEFAHADVVDNPVDRCYRCKKFIFSSLISCMAKKGGAVIVEGTNLDDTKVYRPGIKALKELKICSPLMECLFTKEEVRSMMSSYGLAVAKRPSTPCMATRFPYGTHLTREGLARVEKAEEVLKGYGLYNVRVRVHGDVARIEADADAMNLFIAQRMEISRQLKELGYHYVTLDLEGFRSGSMDIYI